MFTKEQQTYKNKEPTDDIPFGKRKNRGGFGTKKYHLKKKSDKNLATPEERDFLNWIHTQDYKCFVCGKRSLSDPIEWHHVKNGSSSKKNHFRLIPLCGNEHHRSGKLSPHGGAKNFKQTFSYELQMKFAECIYLEYKKENK